MDAAGLIKASLSMRIVAERYGFSPDRSGYIRCPFHDEKTASLKLYDEPGKGFCCFGCNTKGSVIDFTMHLFSITFRQAVLRLGSDFGLIADSGHVGRKELRRVQMEQAAKRRAKQQREDGLQALAEEHCAAWWIVKTKEPWTDGWCDAVKRLPMINIEMEGLCTQETTT